MPPAQPCSGGNDVNPPTAPALASLLTLCHARARSPRHFEHYPCFWSGGIASVKACRKQARVRGHMGWGPAGPRRAHARSAKRSDGDDEDE